MTDAFMNQGFSGSWVAIVTPMHEDGRLDEKSFCALIDWHVESGTDAIVVAGTTGEAPTLSFDEHLALVRLAVAHARGRIPIIAGTGSNCTREAIELTEGAAAAGAQAALVVTPYYNRPTQEGLFLHFAAIARATPLPLVLYNVPARTGVNISDATVQRLAEFTTICGIKEASGDIGRISSLLRLLPQGFAVFTGDDALALPALAMGACGVISVTANVCPREMAALCSLAKNLDLAAARDIEKNLSALNQALFFESNPIPVKWALARMGRIPPGIRMPLVPLSVPHHEALLAAMKISLVAV